LPIMIYHPLQLIVCSILAERYVSRQRAQVARQNEAIVSAR
ncbi:MAG: bile acid:sodium symporter, partial [Pseudomonas sp.]